MSAIYSLSWKSWLAYVAFIEGSFPQSGPQYIAVFGGTIPLLVRIMWALPMHYPGHFPQYTQEIMMDIMEIMMDIMEIMTGTPSGRGSPRTRGSNVLVPSRRTPTPWWTLQVGLEWSMWGSSTGPAAGSLLGNESQSPEQRRWHHWIPALETIDYPENFGFQDYQGFQDSGDGNEHWIWIVEGKINT